MDFFKSLSPRFIYPMTPSQKKSNLLLKKKIAFKARRKEKRLKSQFNRREYMRIYLNLLLTEQSPYRATQPKNNIHHFFYPKPHSIPVIQKENNKYYRCIPGKSF